MVHRKTIKVPPIKKVGLLVLASVSIALAIFVVWATFSAPSSDTGITKNEKETAKKPDKPKNNSKPSKLQLLVDNWAKNQSYDVGIMIYDLDKKKVSAKHNVDKTFFSASLYKLFVVYEGYKRVDKGQWSLDDAFLAKKNRGQCLNLAISKSDSSCATSLLGEIGAGNLNEINRKYGIKNTDVINLYTTAGDMVKILKKIWYKDNLSKKSANLLLDSMLNQPIDYRYGLPYGFTKSKVYNKVGYEKDKYYHDAAIVVTPKGRHYAVAVLTNSFNYHQIADLGRQIEQKIL